MHFKQRIYQIKMKSFLLGIGMSLVSVLSFSQKVTLNLTDIRSDKGQIEISVYENAQQFKDEKPLKYLYFDKKGLKDGKMTIQIQLKTGNYGLTFLDDEDSSKGMTFKMGFYPKEGVGFSNFKFKGVSKPKFDDFKFELNGDKTIDVPFRYF